MIAGDTLLVGEGTHLTQGARVVALNVLDGSLKWSHETIDHVESTPVVHQGRVYIGAGDKGGIRCLDLETGELIWHLPGETYQDAETSVVAYGDRVIVGLGVDGHAIVILDAETGELRRWIETEVPVFSPGAVADGKLYIGMGRGDFVNEGEPPAGELWRIDLARAEQDPEYTHDWKVQVSHTILGAVALGERHAYVATRRGQVLAVDRHTGRIAHEWDAHAPIMASPALTEELLYVVTRSGMLYGLDRETFEPVWQFPVGSQPSVHDPGVLSSPVIARGRVYVGTQREGFRAVGEPDQGQIPVWDGELGGPGVGGNPLRTAVPGLGAYAWGWPAGLEGQTDAVVVAAPPAVMGNRLVVPVAMPGVAGIPAGLAALQPMDPRDGAGSPLWMHEDPAGVHHSPAIVGDGDGATVVALTGKAGQDAPRVLLSLAMADGSVRWTTPVGADAPGLLRVTPDLILAGEKADTLAAWSAEGGRLWSRSLGPLRGLSQVEQHRVAAVTDLALTLLDAPTGAVLWTAPVAASDPGFARLDGLRVLVATATGIQAHALTDGAALSGDDWSAPAHAVASAVVMTRDTLAYVSDDRHLIVLRRDNGRLAAAPFGPVFPGLPPMVSGDDLLVTAPDGSILLVDLDGEASPDRVLRATPWADASWVGTPVAPSIFFRTGILTPRAGWGLVSLETGP